MEDLFSCLTKKERIIRKIWLIYAIIKNAIPLLVTPLILGGLLGSLSRGNIAVSLSVLAGLTFFTLIFMLDFVYTYKKFGKRSSMQASGIQMCQHSTEKQRNQLPLRMNL